MKRLHRAVGVLLTGALMALAFAAPAAAAGPPQMVKDINTSGSSDPQQLTAMNGKLYFTAKGGGKGRELYVSDGTSAGTKRVKDIRPGPGGSQPTELVAVGSLLYFTADDGVAGREVWVSDGTSAGTQALTDHDPGTDNVGSPPWLTAVGGLLYFFADRADDRLELWKTNGTAAGTSRVKILPEDTFVAEPPAAHGGRLFFGLYQCLFNTCTGEGLWVSNGTGQGTKHFFSSVVDESYPSWITSAGGKLYWNDDVNGLYRSNGTAAKTKSMGGVLALTFLVEFNGILFFNGSETSPIPNNGDLWKSNGTVGGTTMVKDMNRGFLSPTPVGNLLFFGSLSDGGNDLWVTDGTEAGTENLLFVFDPQPLDDFVDVNGTFYFHAFSGQLWTSDGTVDGTVEVYGGIGNATQFTNVGGTLFFASGGGDNANGVELWKYVP